MIEKENDPHGAVFTDGRMVSQKMIISRKDVDNVAH